ncbi:MAG: hypothetical protein KGN01_07560, partial [Patescibacteria group bacterium]|nr:hypothetical protein [Patescibacteria group bacterium]
QTSMQQLNQSYQTAIQNALNYNQLLIQRQQLIQNEATQELQILSQGVLVRQQTSAQSKAQQIEQLQVSTQLQLEQMNQQIAVAQYQLSTSQQIFNLANTRIGLETQLVQLQMQQINMSNINIAATEALLSQFEQVGGVTSISSVLAAALGIPGTYPTYRLTGAGLPLTQGQSSAISTLQALVAAYSAGGTSPTIPTASTQPVTGPSNLEAVSTQYFNQQGLYGSYNNAPTP